MLEWGVDIEDVLTREDADFANIGPIITMPDGLPTEPDER